jgi:hypothetical protein
MKLVQKNLKNRLTDNDAQTCKRQKLEEHTSMRLGTQNATRRGDQKRGKPSVNYIYGDGEMNLIEVEEEKILSS